MGKPRIDARGPAFLLAAAALAMALSTAAVEGPFDEISHDVSLDLRIDINRADRHAVESLPGVGPVLAGRILQHRAVHGPFRKSADLEAVRGIGAGRVRTLESYIETGEGKGSVGALDDEVGGGNEGRVDGRR